MTNDLELSVQVTAIRRKDPPEIHLDFVDLRNTPTRLRGTAIVRADGMRITGLQVEDPDVNTSTLRELRLGGLRVDLNQCLRSTTYTTDLDKATVRLLVFRLMHPSSGYRSPEEADDDADDAAFIRKLTKTLHAVNTQHRLPTIRPARGRGARSDAFYRDVALGYLRAAQEDPRRVILNLTDSLRSTLKQPRLSTHTVSTWVRRARKDGWLSTSAPGVAGGAGGPRLNDWLKWYRQQNLPPGVYPLEDDPQ